MGDRWVPPPRSREYDSWEPHYGGSSRRFPRQGGRDPYTERSQQWREQVWQADDHRHASGGGYGPPYPARDERGYGYGQYPQYGGPSGYGESQSGYDFRPYRHDHIRNPQPYYDSGPSYGRTDTWRPHQSRAYSNGPERAYQTRSQTRHDRSSPPEGSRNHRDAQTFPEPVLRSPLWRHPERQSASENHDRSQSSSAQNSRSSSRDPQAAPPAPPPPRSSLPSFPDERYIRISSEKPGAPVPKEGFFPKLLILDLNGALVYRTARSGEKRKAYPRPYLASFLEYLFLPENPAQAEEQKAPSKSKAGKSPPLQAQLRPYEIFVWSSAQPHNVKSMVENTFGLKWPQGVWELEKKRVREERLARGEGRILKVWARDTLGLSAAEYGKKVQTIKDLRKVIDFFKSSEAVEYAHLPPFDERNCLLIDDSPLKAVCQPWNQLVIPEYDKKEFQASREVAMRLAKDPEASTEGLDEILLGVIGILEGMRTVENVPAWIRAGGLLSTDRDAVVDLTSTPRLEDLPSHADFRHWYDRPEQLVHWIKKGKQALQRKGIVASIGLDAQAAVSET